MTIIVTDKGFHTDDWQAEGGMFVDLEKYAQDVVEKIPSNTALDIPNDTNVDSLDELFDHVAMIRIPFPGFADGRGFQPCKAVASTGLHWPIESCWSHNCRSIWPCQNLRF